MKPPVPGIAQTPASAPVKTTCRVVWPDGAEVTAEHEAHFPSEETPVRWSGAIDKLAAPPRSADACYLVTYLEHQAEETGGTFNQTSEGTWAGWDEVK